jgi:hypothetical protein
MEKDLIQIWQILTCRIVELTFRSYKGNEGLYAKIKGD